MHPLRYKQSTFIFVSSSNTLEGISWPFKSKDRFEISQCPTPPALGFLEMTQSLDIPTPGHKGETALAGKRQCTSSGYGLWYFFHSI